LKEPNARAALVRLARHVGRDDVLGGGRLALEALRLGHRLSGQWTIDDRALAQPVAALSVQPLVENSVKHAFNPRSAPGRLTISAQIDDAAGQLVIEVEDEPLARETLRDFVTAWPALQLVGEAADGAQALRAIESLVPDLVFMDIQMPGMSGLEVVRSLKSLPSIVFTTGYDQHAVAAFELNAVDYLLEPFSRERFDIALQRVLEEEAAPREAAEPRCRARRGARPRRFRASWCATAAASSPWPPTRSPT
jgi:CheY-like chemotaxis protein